MGRWTQLLMSFYEPTEPEIEREAEYELTGPDPTQGDISNMFIYSASNS